MSRKQRQEAAQLRRREMGARWLARLQKLMVEGESYSKAIEILACAVSKEIDAEPNRQAEIIQAYREMMDKIKDALTKQ